MRDGKESSKNEFASFLDDIAEEISQRVESLPPPDPKKAERKPFNAERHIFDWPRVVDRMIDEMR